MTLGQLHLLALMFLAMNQVAFFSAPETMCVRCGRLWCFIHTGVCIHQCDPQVVYSICGSLLFLG